MFRLVTRGVLTLGAAALIPLSCGGGDERTFVDTTGGAGGQSGAGGVDASAGFGGAVPDGGKTCSSAAECDDGNSCNGEESCDGTYCQPGKAPSDGTACEPAVDGGVGDSGVSYVCIAGTCRASCKDDTDCDDNDVCTGTETCSPTTKTCQEGTPLTCDDKDDCTENSCDSEKGCFYPLIDKDGDGHAAESLGACGDDCDDNDKDVYAGAAELCDNKDNNCDGKKDETAPIWYPDCDKDTFPAAGATSTQQCAKPTTAPPGCAGGTWTSTAPGKGTTDCWDKDPKVHPYTASENSKAWSTKAITGATTAVDFDYNCDAKEEKRFTKGYVSTSASCSLQCGPPPLGLCYCAGSAGYTGAVPECGKSSSYTSCSLISFSCKRTSATQKTQECR